MPKKRKAAAQPPGPGRGKKNVSQKETGSVTGTLAATEAPDVAAVVGTTRPVIAGRVSQESYDRIKAWSAASGRSMSEELAWRAEQTVAWEKAHGTAQALLAEAHRIVDRNIEAALRQRGFLPVRLLPQGKAWISPDADREKLNLAIDVNKLAHDMLPGLEAALHEALGAMAKTED